MFLITIYYFIMLIIAVHMFGQLIHPKRLYSNLLIFNKLKKSTTIVTKEYEEAVVETIGFNMLFRIWLLFGWFTPVNSVNSLVIFMGLVLFSVIISVVRWKKINFVLHYIRLIVSVILAILLTMNEIIFKIQLVI